MMGLSPWLMLLFGVILGHISGMYWANRSQIERSDQTTDIKGAIGLIGSALQEGKSVEIRPLVTGGFTVIRFARTKTGALNFKGHRPLSKLSNANESKEKGENHDDP